MPGELPQMTQNRRTDRDEREVNSSIQKQEMRNYIVESLLKLVHVKNKVARL